MIAAYCPSCFQGGQGLVDRHWARPTSLLSSPEAERQLRERGIYVPRITTGEEADCGHTISVRSLQEFNARYGRKLPETW